MHPAGAVRRDPWARRSLDRQEPLTGAAVAGSASTPGGRESFLILALRWATVVTGAVLSLSELDREPGTVAATAVLLVYSTWRTLRPVPRPGHIGVHPVRLAIEVAVAVGAVVASGGWESPFVFTVLVPILLGGFTWGYSGGLALATLSSAALAAAGAAFPSDAASAEAALQVALVYAATAVVAGFARRLKLEALEQRAALDDRVVMLTEANALLAQLTRLATTLPSSLDIGDTLAAAMGHFRQLFDFTGSAILVLDSATGTWRAEAAAGLPAPPPMATKDLPLSLRTAVEEWGVVCTPHLDPGAGVAGLWPGSLSGLYGAFVARGRVVALAALEHTDPGHFGDAEVELLVGLGESLALAIDNGLWFERLKMLGAEGERDRLARNLHDRVGQGLAYVNLELDRLSRLPEPGPDLLRLREDVGGLLAEVRETLGQLRSRVTETTGLAALAQAYIPRFAQRTGIAAEFHGEPGGARLPVPVEQELWRILQEALSNVERHSRANRVDVIWTVDGDRARLEVRDDGRGFRHAAIGDVVTSGIMAMRERANAVGARLRVESEPGSGTRVAVEVELER